MKISVNELIEILARVGCTVSPAVLERLKTARYIVVQATDGRAIELDTDTGKITYLKNE